MLSLITPTYERDTQLTLLYHLILSQKIKEKWEWLILDDSLEPSPFFSKLLDPKVKYIHSQKKETVGAKRNRLTHLAQGDMIVHMDDDDYYAPNYLQKVFRTLKTVDFFSLSSWFCYSIPHQQFFYWSTEDTKPYCFVLNSLGELHVQEKGVIGELVSKGFGFSYAYQRRVLEKASFSPLQFGEDFDFFQKVEKGGFSIANEPDKTGIALVLRHDMHLSHIFPQYRIPSFIGHNLFPDFANYNKFYT